MKISDQIKQAGYLSGLLSVKNTLDKKAELDWSHLATGLGGAGIGGALGYMAGGGGSAKPTEPSAYQAEADQSAGEDEQYIELNPGQYEQLMQMYYQNPYAFQQG